MQNRTLIAAVVVVLLLLTVAVETRYSMQTVQPGYAYVLDRWTGKVAFVAGKTLYESKAAFVDPDEGCESAPVKPPAAASNPFDKFDPQKTK